MNVTLITGATSGIGEALAYQLAGRKHNLLLIARNKQKLKKLCEELAAKNSIEAQYIVADLSEYNAPRYIFEEINKRNLSVNVLVNNAGIGSSGEFVKNDFQSDLDMLQLNNASLVALCQLFLPEMVKRKSGTLINVGSLASFFPSPYMAVYAASKAFVRSFTEALTEECKPYGIHVMLFCPGFTSTNFMNTPANNNEWGKTLVKGAYTQTSEQVAAEIPCR
ncbi:SDR family oxidoreductase [Rhodocytophaga aerolata]|uniref:SDR family oxidoreductase n=1 Tax=Rhodocytophaga aerolata TaxID=455078 RepID=A0ABT8RHG4_9BACT|nr:SDR family oxidoreductase [Rhodocytophaga aerolata]MDO1451547.1 SDR family oxidoreductase [Rhodocytophaga aerolata]